MAAIVAATAIAVTTIAVTAANQQKLVINGGKCSRAIPGSVPATVFWSSPIIARAVPRPVAIAGQHWPAQQTNDSAGKKQSAKFCRDLHRTLPRIAGRIGKAAHPLARDYPPANLYLSLQR
jgi:hypothetical protein